MASNDTITRYLAARFAQHSRSLEDVTAWAAYDPDVTIPPSDRVPHPYGLPDDFDETAAARSPLFEDIHDGPKLSACTMAGPDDG
jgi:hypothetical protein